MKTRNLRDKAVALILATMMTASPVWGTVFAADEAALDQQPAAAAEVKEEVKAEAAPAEESAKAEVKEEAKEAIEEKKVEAPAEEQKAAEKEAAAEETKPAEAAPVEARKQASSYKVTVNLVGIKNADGSEGSVTLSSTVSTKSSKTYSASTLNAKVKTKSVKIDGVTYKFEGLWADGSGNEVSSIYINGADLWDPAELTYRAVYSAIPDKKVTVVFTGIMKADGSIIESSDSNTLSAGTGWSFTQKKLDNKITVKSFSLNGDKYEYSGKWVDENGNEFTSLKINNADIEGDTVITVRPVYNITECKKLSFNYIDGVSTGSGSWANKGETSSYTHTFKQPEAQKHYQFINWENDETKETYLGGDKYSVMLKDLPETRNEVNVYANWQPSVTVRYNYNGNTAEAEDFEGISVYDKTTVIDGIEYNGWYDAEGNRLAEDAAFEAPAPVREKTERSIIDVYARRPVTITAASAEWTYDGKAHSDESVAVTAGGLFEGDEIEAEISASITEVGEADNRIESVRIMRGSEDVSAYYDITAEDGALSIKAAPAVITNDSKPAAPAAPAVRKAADNTEAAVTIADTAAPMAAPAAAITDSDSPLAQNPVWALLNLIMTIATGIISAVLLAGWFGKKEDDEEAEDENTKRKGMARLASIIPAAGSIIAFILTENMNNTMVLIDRWTLLMGIILIIQAVIAVLAKKETEKAEAEAEAEAINA